MQKKMLYARCDRCGADCSDFYTVNNCKNEQTQINTYGFYNFKSDCIQSGGITLRPFEFDLCIDCTNALGEWLKQK